MERDSVVLVTGASSGIGKAVASRFLAEGYKVIATGRRFERLIELRDATPEDQKSNLLIAELDVTNYLSVAEFLAHLPAEFKSIQILVNNAGLALGLEPAYKAELLEWFQMIDTNIKGLINITNEVLPGMIERNHGHIFNVGSVAGTYPYPGGNVYGSTKAFVHEYSSDLRAGLANTALRVSSIEPGMISGTEFSNVRLKDDERAAKVYDGIKALSAEDMAETIFWAANLPTHVSINKLEVMPVQQSFSAPNFYREKDR
ncbi:SDR family NAD(P)-dependent oxidoreductase [Polynucleobacter brandtiae]|uniref:3-hydroxy acid dehydrogenase/malonic semialdehyde reductase n=1 Tax=Polynucleobacter brandtiae TaxID=1938816 RepID=A0A2M8VZ35_9BURK|nr:SDR family NAD(P)-dependent oxidoreductase [Polynucleobacter brandtiae]PJI83105.1 3-hydroxy acid dehydrogenase/malonic semialdehyde reductase [Polynucleobacter brandtiae]